MTAALCWLAAAVWFSTAGRPRDPARRRSSNRARRQLPDLARQLGVGPAAVGETRPSPAAVGGTRLSPAGLRWIAAGAAIAAAVVVFGPLPGGLGGLLTAPIVVRLIALVQTRETTRVSADVARRIPLVLDLLAAGLRGGLPVVTAVSSVAPLAGAPLAAQLDKVAGLLRFGAQPATAWAALENPALAPIARTAVRSAESGVRLARGFELLAAELRDEARAAAVARAHRAGVWAMAPLGLCFLPAFACLGVLPVIVGIARGVLSGTP